MDQESIYIGNRYVPKLVGEWNQLKDYEGLSIVTLNGSSYTSKKTVPAGVDISNEEYWVKTGDSNGELIQFKEEFTEKLGKTREYENILSYGADPTGTLSSYNALLNAIKRSNEKGTTVYIPQGNYLIDQTIDFNELPRLLTSDLGDYDYRIKIEGEDIHKTCLITSIGLTKLFSYTPEDITLRRSFSFKNIRIRSKEIATSTVKANIILFELLASPHSHFENIDFRGVDRGLHMRNCWSSTFKNIVGHFCNKSIFIDGTSPDGSSGGYADYVLLDNISTGIQIRDYGIFLLGSRGSKITRFNSEGGGLGHALKIEACQSTIIDTFYIESYNSMHPVSIGGRGLLKNIVDFSTDTIIMNGHIYSPDIATFRLRKGIINLKISNMRFSYNKNTPNNITSQYAFDSDVDRDIGFYYQNLDLMDNHFYDSNYAYNFINSKYALISKHNGKTIIQTNNPSYYNPTFEAGTELLDLSLATAKKSYVTRSGTMSTLTDVTGSTVENSNVVTFNSVVDLKIGTYLTIGTLVRVKVDRIDMLENSIIIGGKALTTQTNVPVNYTQPEIKELV